MTLWAEIQKYQYLIVGVIGLAGVIFTLRYNAREARRQRQDERRHERQTLRTALTEELKVHRLSLIQNLESVEDSSKSESCYVPTDPMDDTYWAFAHQIGLLSQEEVGKVMNAYLTLRTYCDKLYLIGVSAGTGDRHVHVPAKNISMLSGMQRSLIDPIDKAIQAMELAGGAD